MTATWLVLLTTAFADAPEAWDATSSPAIVAPDGIAGTCTAYIRLSDDGTPRTVNVSGCDDDARVVTTTGLQAWTWPAPGEHADVDLSYTVTLTPGVAAAVTEAEAPRVHRDAVEEEPTKIGFARGTGAGLVVKTTANPDAIVLMHTVPAKVPEAARAYEKGTTLSCTVSVVLKRSGAPDTITPTDCPPEMREVSLDAVKKWRWTRTAEDAPPLVGFTTEVTVNVRIL